MEVMKMLRSFVERKMVVMILIIGVLINIPIKVLAYPIADSFRYPVDGYKVDGYSFRDGHPGEDCGKEPLTPVYAIANGRVVISMTGVQGYEQVIVIEHKLPLGDPAGEYICSIYGHLSKRDGYKIIPFDREVDKNTIIGYVGFDDENGIGGPHLHFGIRIGADDGTWRYKGQGVSTAGFLKPSEFIAQKIQSEESFSKFRSLTDSYLNSPFPNTRYFNGKARDLVGNPLYEQRENGNKHQEYWSFLIPTDKGWSLCITYAPGAIPSEDKYLAPYPVAIHPELVNFYKANRSSLGSALCDTVLGRFDGIVELGC